jgi:HPt (histidine-containing phosphotransfer) domain-containing protein
MQSEADVAAIDRAHLKAMTMGDEMLAREVLALFDRQGAMLMKRLPGADGKAKAEMAHALKGSARGIGAWRVADAATLVEIAGDAIALKELNEMVAEARAEIALVLKEASPF